MNLSNIVNLVQNQINSHLRFQKINKEGRHIITLSNCGKCVSMQLFISSRHGATLAFT